MQKARDALATDSVKKRLDKAKSDMTKGRHKEDVNRAVEELAYSFIRVLRDEIQSCGGTDHAAGQLGPTAIDPLMSLEYGKVVPLGDGLYQIPISFAGKLERDSLDPAEYDGIDNIAALLNNGYIANSSIYGVWMGHTYYNIPSLPQRTGAYFVQNAIRNFVESYASGKYFYLDVEENEIYKQ